MLNSKMMRRTFQRNQTAMIPWKEIVMPNKTITLIIIT